MTQARRPLTLADVAEAMTLSAASPPDAVYARIGELAAATVGFKLLTVLRFVEASQEVERLYSSDPKAYPVGGRKTLKSINKDHSLAASGEIFLAANEEAVRRTFPDHGIIFSLGAGAVLNAPIRHAGRRLGTMNLCGLANSFGPDAIEHAKALANVLAPTLLAAER